MSSRGRYWIWGAILCIVFVALYMVKEILLPFVAGMAIAYILDPILDRLERIGLSRLIATVLLTATFFVLIIASITLIFPLLQGQIVVFLKKLLLTNQENPCSISPVLQGNAVCRLNLKLLLEAHS